MSLPFGLEWSYELLWIVIGFGGQALFSARFLIQWIVSEKQRKSVIPLAFWYFSLGGGLTLFSYALYRGDPVFIAGQGAGVFIYLRNLYLIYRERRGNDIPVEADAPRLPDVEDKK